MSFRSRFLDALCDHKHQFPMILKLLIVMGVLLSVSIVYLGPVAALNHPMIVVDAVLIGGAILFFSAALRYCVD